MTVKTIWIVFWLLFFFVYLPLTREPSLFNLGRTKGYVIGTTIHGFRAGTKTQTHENPVVKYYVDSVEYYFNPPISTNYLGFYRENDVVTIIYDLNNPVNAKIAGLIGYFINYSELAVALLIVSFITILNSAIKNWHKTSYESHTGK